MIAMPDCDIREHAFYAALAVLVRRYPGVDIDDLKDRATDGVVEAIQKWRRGRGMTFATFAAYKAKLIARRPAGVSRSAKRREFFAFASLNNIDRPFEAKPVRRQLDLSELKLNDRERRIIEMRLRGITMEEIGKALDVTQARISQLVKKVIERNRI